jgi:MoaA/NifB/PqqE/SkfB family radical SAM enzyme
MYPAFDKVLDLCQEARLMVNITTNGLLLPKWEDALLQSKALRQINVSLQSLIIQNEDKRREYLDYLVFFIRKAQVSAPFYMSLRLWNDERKNDVLSLNRMVISHLQQAFGITIPEDFDGFRLTDRVYLSKDEEFVWPGMGNPFNSDRGYCMGGKTHIAILSDGTVCICCLDQNGISNLENVFEKSLSDILKSEKFQEIVEGFSKRKAVLEICRKCTFRDRFM